MSGTTKAGRVLGRVFKTVVLAGVLGVTLLVVPDPSVSPAETALVKIESADGVDLSPDVIWIMAVGSDARPGQKMTRSRGDALQLVGINTQTGAAVTFGIPRDSYVDIAGHGGDKINAALYLGGPKLMAAAVGDLIGIEPDYVLVAGFKGLQRMVNGIGGITVDNPVAFSDNSLKPEGFKAGKIRLKGYDALAFSRIRHNLIGGDFDRSANQQRTLVGILKQVRDRADRPGFMEAGVRSVLKNMDTNASPGELFRIAQAIAQVDPRKVTRCVLRGGLGTVGGASVVFPDRTMAERLGDQARKDATIRRC